MPHLDRLTEKAEILDKIRKKLNNKDIEELELVLNKLKRGDLIEQEKN